MESRVSQRLVTHSRQWSKLDGQLCRDLNPAARDIVDKHLCTTPREYTADYR